MAEAKKRTRDLVKIDKDKCTGCNACVGVCRQCALRIVDGKVTLNETMCDGHGACVSSCPVGALSVVTGTAAPYHEEHVIAEAARHGRKAVVAHLQHLIDKGNTFDLNDALEYLTAHESETKIDPMMCVNELQATVPPQSANPCAAESLSFEEFAEGISPKPVSPFLSPLLRLMTPPPKQMQLSPNITLSPGQKPK